MITFKLLLIHQSITSQKKTLRLDHASWLHCVAKEPACELSYSNSYIYTRVDRPGKTQSWARLHLTESKLKKE